MNEPPLNTTYKILDWAHAQRQVKAWHAEGGKVGFTNGCFDLLHAGHVRYLQDAASQVDHLVLGLNSDASVRRLKGPTRPIVPEADRAYLLSALQAIAAVVLFEEDTPFELIAHLEPDVLMKGGDYRAEEIVGYELVTQKGGDVLILPFVDGRSTTNIVNRILENHA
jgi:D-beta-D-heptose 7-phosphate kinase/D-beta-D-heptose 1-phosphate adenosyltransferase